MQRKRQNQSKRARSKRTLLVHRESTVRSKPKTKTARRRYASEFLNRMVQGPSDNMKESINVLGHFPWKSAREGVQCGALRMHRTGRLRTPARIVSKHLRTCPHSRQFLRARGQRKSPEAWGLAPPEPQWRWQYGDSESQLNLSDQPLVAWHRS